MFNKIIYIFFIIGLSICGCSEFDKNITENPVLPLTDNGTYDTLDLTIDAVQQGGMTESQINYYISIGYVLDTIQTPTLFNVQFLGEDGYYNRIGYIRSGEVFLYYPFSEPMTGYAKTCTNQLELFD